MKQFSEHGQDGVPGRIARSLVDFVMPTVKIGRNTETPKFTFFVEMDLKVQSAAIYLVRGFQRRFLVILFSLISSSVCTKASFPTKQTSDSEFFADGSMNLGANVTANLL